MASFSTDALIRISRFDTAYPTDEPTSFVVGFTVTCNRNNKSKYTDIAIPYTDVKDDVDDDAVVAHAWSKLREQFQTWLDSVYTKSSIIGSVFSP